MRSTLALVLLTALLAAAPGVLAAPGSGAPTAAAAAAAARRKATRRGRVRAVRCPRGTVAFGPARARQGCVRRPAASAAGRFDALERTLALAPSAPRRAKRPSARARTLARRLASAMLRRAQAGEPALRVVRGGAARAARAPGARSPSAPRARAAASGAALQGVPGAAGRPVGVTLEGAEAQAVFDAGRGLRTTIRLQADDDGDATQATFEVTDRSGAGVIFGLGERGPPTPTCPTAAGDVPSRLRQELVVGAIVVDGKRRHRRIATQVIEGSWHGYVAVTARAQRFDVSLRGSLEVRSRIESVATGRILQHQGTRTFRTALDRRGLPVGVDPVGLLGELRLRGPKGRRIPAGDVREASTLVAFTAAAVAEVDGELERGDRRWYDERACARVDHTSSPERVSKGGRADWELTALAADGQRVADAVWAPSSACGTLTASAARGPSIRLAVSDDAGSWGPEPYAPACASAEVTTTAGRPRAFQHQIAPSAASDLRVDISVVYREDMGPGVVPTEMTGSGSVTIGHGERSAEGVGQWSASEWWVTPENTCGQEMTRARNVGGAAVVGAQDNGDGTVTVAFTALERPLNMAWVWVFPADGGTLANTRQRQFCGDPAGARLTTEITVRVTRIERPWGR